MQHPYLGIANRAIDQIMKMDAELGLTPSSRSRLHIQRPKEESAYEKFKARRVQPAEETPARVN
jgi:P27 family predicted phage terminase small subunit